MNKTLKNELCNYLGELMNDHEHEFDWILKDEIIEKINAVNLILGFDNKIKTWYEKVSEALNK